MLLVDREHSGYFNFQNQKRDKKEMLQAEFLHMKCSSPKGVMKA